MSVGSGPVTPVGAVGSPVPGDRVRTPVALARTRTGKLPQIGDIEAPFTWTKRWRLALHKAQLPL